MKKYLLVLYLSLFTFYSLLAQNGWLWGDGGNGLVTLSSLSTDKDGNCFAFGLYRDNTVHFDSYTFLDSTQNLAFFFLKLNPAGNILWAQQAISKGIPASIDNHGMTTDMLGNSYCVGSFSDTIIFGSTTLVNPIVNVINGNNASFIVKYDMNGNVRWARQSFLISDTSIVAPNAASLDNKGNCYEDGIFWGIVSIGGDTLKPTSIYGGDFLAKYDTNGNFKWVKQSTGEADYWYMTNDRYGNSFIIGDFFNTVAFDIDTIRAQNYSGGWAFITKYDSNGNVLWAKQGLSLSHTISGGGVMWRAVTDLSGNIYGFGYFTDTIVFAPYTLIANSYQSIFIVKYDPNGNVIWAKQTEILDNNEWYPDGLAIDKFNHIYFSGDGGAGNTGNYEIKFGDTTLQINRTSTSSSALFIFKIDSSANVLCANIIQGGGNDGWNGLASDSSGNFVYISGYTSVPLVFGKDIITAAPYSPFIARWEECDTSTKYASIQNIKPIEKIKLYPNPNNGKFNIHSSEIIGGSSIEIYNVLGEKVYSNYQIIKSPNYQIDMPSQSSGVYFYRVLKEDGTLIGEGKLMIQK